MDADDMIEFSDLRLLLPAPRRYLSQRRELTIYDVDDWTVGVRAPAGVNRTVCERLLACSRRTQKYFHR